MKRRLNLIPICFAFASCIPCANLDCIGSNYNPQFRIVSAVDGKDLLFGPNPTYDPDSIQFFSLKGTDTTFHDFTLFVRTDSVIQASFPDDNAVTYIRYNYQDTDTLFANYDSYKSKCCGTITDIVGLRSNGTELQQQEENVYLLRK